jgi:hypothetical protein
MSGKFSIPSTGIIADHDHAHCGVKEQWALVGRVVRVAPARGAQDTFYVGNMKGVGRIYQQTFVDTYSKVAFAKLYDRKTPITVADLLNDRVGLSSMKRRSSSHVF